ncbi:hypothetical protein [Butyrivibrio fibrisolvens]|uniref:hypothetical protein n=1 Tax=Butyrivibrio fibrisolvens TaxID=831 RepID=UPI0003B59BFF|nr:hypothetical protein [Butyrivibrio fibrisolvens]
MEEKEDKMRIYPEANKKFLEQYNKNSSGFSFIYNKTGNLDDIYMVWAENYFDAAEYITYKLLEKGNQQIIQLDSYFLPLAFLYRQSLELIIKAIMLKYQGEAYTKKEIEESFHDLKSLIDALQPTISQYINYLREIEWLKNYVDSVASFDRASDSFRYPYKVKREKDVLFGVSYKFEYIFESRVDIDLVTMVNQFRVANAILKDIFSGKMCSYNECDSVEPEFMKQGGGYYYKAVIGKGYDMDMFSKYIRGYDEVAIKLFDMAEKFFLPICYLLRNSIELQLKNMYMRYTSNIKWMSVLKNIYESKHAICKLWDLNKDIVCGTGSASKQEIYLVGDYLKSIHNFDSDSAHFRYPTDKQLNLFSSRKKYDGQNMINYMVAVLNAIDGINMTIDDFYSNTDTSIRMI